MELIAKGRWPSARLTRGSFLNAIVALAAIGGSTNAVVHLLAIAGRAGIALTLDDFDTTGAGVPLLVDLQPAGRFLMEDFHRAGGLLAVLREVRDLLDPDALTVTGEPVVSHLDDAPIWDRKVIRRRGTPLRGDAGIAVLYGNLARSGAAIKPAAASQEPLQHRGKAVVFDTVEDLHARIDDPDLDVDATSVLVPRGCRPKRYPGMPEVANMPVPTKLLEEGVRDMVRICDGRMSGTGYGTVVLHVAPEAAAGGPLGLVRTGDSIVLDVPGRRLFIDIPQAELDGRAPSVAGCARPTRGWERLYIDQVQQADTGVDLDFLVGSSGDKVSRESHRPRPTAWPERTAAGRSCRTSGPPPAQRKVARHPDHRVDGDQGDGAVDAGGFVEHEQRGRGQSQPGQARHHADQVIRVAGPTLDTKGVALMGGIGQQRRDDPRADVGQLRAKGTGPERVQGQLRAGRGRADRGEAQTLAGDAVHRVLPAGKSHTRSLGPVRLVRWWRGCVPTVLARRWRSGWSPHRCGRGDAQPLPTASFVAV